MQAGNRKEEESEGTTALPFKDHPSISTHQTLCSASVCRAFALDVGACVSEKLSLPSQADDAVLCACAQGPPGKCSFPRE